ncbi:MAG TPA: DUF2252 family protein [Gemmataceae bacterium]|nr:DUF2252 family protein [Gemmataceae bacterium]
MRDPVAEFMSYNRPFVSRGPELLRLKVARMASSPFAFFRGTFPLFARDALDKQHEALPSLSIEGAELDLVGDIHSENYGTFKAADGNVHYDVNDFDETTRGRFTFDVARLATSLFLAAREVVTGLDQTVPVVVTFLKGYAAEVQRLVRKGGAVDVSEASPSGVKAVDEFVAEKAALKRPAFVERLTEADGKRRRFVRGRQYYNLPDDQAAQARRLLDDYRKRPEAPPGSDDFYAVQDVAGRVAGIGSMGRYRYAVLLAGKGSAEARNVILEFKESLPSAYDTARGRDTDAAALRGRAGRVIAVQRRSQAAAGNYLGVAQDGGLSFQVREIGPAADRIEFKKLATGPHVAEVAAVQARILARVHARAVADAVGPTNPLAELEDADVFGQRLLAFALAYADLAARDYQAFVGRRAEIEDTAKWA